MKKKLDVYLIYFAWFTDFVYHFCGRMFYNYTNGRTFSVDENGYRILGKIQIFADLQEIAFRIFHILVIAYIIIAVIQVRRNMAVDLRKNVLLTLVMVVFDFESSHYIFNWITISGSLGLKFFTVVLITNTVLYFVYRKYVRDGIIQREENNIM